MKWVAYCMDCKKELVDRCENGSFAETAAKIHAEETGHHIIVGPVLAIDAIFSHTDEP